MSYIGKEISANDQALVSTKSTQLSTIGWVGLGPTLALSQSFQAVAPGN